MNHRGAIAITEEIFLVGGGQLTSSEDAASYLINFKDVHGPIHPDLRSDWSDYQRSLQLLLSLEADALCEGHFGVYRGKPEVVKFIKKFLETQ
jgi:hypothetical protein